MNERRSEPADDVILFDESPALGGSNFLVSAVMILKRQKKELQAELITLKERLEVLEHQNAGFINVSAERLLKKSSLVPH